MSVSILKTEVKKFFLSKNESLFLNEIYWLKKLEKYNFVPKILDIDHENLSISMSNQGEKINNKNKPINWRYQLKQILKILKKINCFHSDIKPDNLLVKNKKITLIDFAQSTKITNLKKDIFLKKRIFYDEYAINRIDLSINKNVIFSNDLRTLLIWKKKYQNFIENKINANKHIKIIDKIKIKKNFYKEKFKNRIFWVDQFYNKDVSKKSEKLKDDIFVYIIQSIDPKFKSKKMIFSKEKRIVDDKIFEFKKNVRNKKFGIVHIADNFEEAKRNAIFLSKSNKDYPAKYFTNTQFNYKNKNEFFDKLNNYKKLKYLVLRDGMHVNDDLDILTNDFYLFKRVSDCHSYKLKNLKFISNFGDPVEENGIKVSNYIMIKDKKIYLDIRYIGDNYYDINWEKKIINKRKSFLNYYIPDKENKIYSLIYHIVYHKGYIDRKYINIIKKTFKYENDFFMIKKKINQYLTKKNYRITRPNDFTIPIPYKLNNFLIDKEIQNIKDQIQKRNYSGVNKMILNIFKFQKTINYFKISLLILVFLNQYLFFKLLFKRYIFKILNYKI